MGIWIRDADGVLLLSAALRRAVSCLAPIGQDGVLPATPLLGSPKYKHIHIWKASNSTLFYPKERGSIHVRNVGIIAHMHMV